MSIYHLRQAAGGTPTLPVASASPLTGRPRTLYICDIIYINQGFDYSFQMICPFLPVALSNEQAVIHKDK